MLFVAIVNGDISLISFSASLSFVYRKATTIARNWKQPRCPPAKEQIKKMWHIYTLEYYSAGKKNSDILKFACKCMELEKKQSEVNQTQKDEHGMYSLISGH